MAAKFLSHLPKVPANELEDTSCIICHEDMGTIPTDSGAFDEPIRTPRNHIMDSVRLANWLERNNTCPYCRHELLTIKSSGNEDIHRDDYQDEQSASRFFDHLCAILAILRSRGDRTGAQQWMAWFSSLVYSLASSRLHEDNFGLAFNAMRRLWGVERDGSEWLRRVAIARCTRRLREYRLYLRLRASELRIQHSPSSPTPRPRRPLISIAQSWLTSELRSGRITVAEAPLDTSDTRQSWDQTPRPQFQVTPAQEDWLLIQLWRRSAFVQAPMNSRNSLRESWDLVRDAGYVFDPEKIGEKDEILGTWSLTPY